MIRFFIAIISIFYCIELYSITLKQAMSEAYNTSPEILALRAKLKASNQEISKVLGQNRPKVNLESSLGYDRTDTINKSNIAIFTTKPACKKRFKTEISSINLSYLKINNKSSGNFFGFFVTKSIKQTSTDPFAHW